MNHRQCVGSFLLAVFAVASPHPTAFAQAPTDEQIKQSSDTLRDSDEAEALRSAAICLIRSREPKHVSAVLERLADKDFLLRLDPPDFPKRTRWWQLPAAKVVVELARLPADQANSALSTLAESRAFVRNSERETMLTEACGEIRDPAKPILRYLTDQVTPTGGTHALRSLARMRNPAACEAIEQLVLSPNYEGRTKKSWFTESFVKYRHEPLILAMYGRMIAEEFKDDRVRNIAVDSLFSFRMLEWYGPVNRVTPPVPWKDMSTPMLGKFLLIAAVAEKQKLEKDVREGMRDACKTIRAILADRAKDS